MAVFFCTNAIYPLATENIAKPLPREAAEAEAALADAAEDTIKEVPEAPSKGAPRVTVTVLLASEDLPAARQWLETIKKAGEELTLSLLDEETDAGERGLLKAMLAASQAADLDGFFLKGGEGASLRFWFSAEQRPTGGTKTTALHSEGGFKESAAHIQAICAPSYIAEKILGSADIKEGSLENGPAIELTLAGLQDTATSEGQKTGEEEEAADKGEEQEGGGEEGQETGEEGQEEDEEDEEDEENEEYEEGQETGDGENRPVTRAGDDHGDTLGAATWFTDEERLDTGIGWSIEGSIDHTGDVDCFVFETGYAADLSVALTGDARDLYIYNVYWSYVTSINTSTYSTLYLNGMGAGTYYAAVSGDVGDYTLTVTATEEDEHKNTLGQATPIAISYHALGAEAEALGRINYTGDADCFVFETRYASDFSVALAGGDTRDFSVYNMYWSYMGGTEAGADKTLHFTGMGDSTYYVKVYGAKGDYSVEFAATEEDDCGNTFNSAKPIFNGIAADRRINYTGDVDFFKFVAESTTDLSVALAGDARDLYIYNAYWSYVTSINTSTYSTLYLSGMGAGTYYAAVSGLKGGYSLTVTGDGVRRGYAGPAPPAEVNYSSLSDTLIEALLVAAGATMDDYRVLLGLQEEVIQDIETPNAPENAFVYEEFYAVAWCVKNRVNNPTEHPNTYEGVVSEHGQFEAYDDDYDESEIENCTKNAAIAALLSDYSTVDDYCYYFGRIGNNYLWYDTEDDNEIPYPPPIVIGNRYVRNVFYGVDGSVHNDMAPDPNEIGKTHIILYYPAVHPNLGYWYDR